MINNNNHNIIIITKHEVVSIDYCLIKSKSLRNHAIKKLKQNIFLNIHGVIHHRDVYLFLGIGWNAYRLRYIYTVVSYICTTCVWVRSLKIYRSFESKSPPIRMNMAGLWMDTTMIILMRLVRWIDVEQNMHSKSRASSSHSDPGDARAFF